MSLTIGAGKATTGGVTVAIDVKGNFGFFLHSGGGSLKGIEAGGALQAIVSNANVENLPGKSVSTGMTIPINQYVGATGEVVFMEEGHVQFNFGVAGSIESATDIEVHTVCESTN
jgi:hypothetical protein